MWRYTSTSQYVIMAWYLIKHRDNFTLTCGVEDMRLIPMVVPVFN